MRGNALTAPNGGSSSQHLSLMKLPKKNTHIPNVRHVSEKTGTSNKKTKNNPKEEFFESRIPSLEKHVVLGQKFEKMPEKKAPQKAEGNRILGPHMFF